MSFGGFGFLSFSNISGYLLYKKNNMLSHYRRLNSTTKLIIIVSPIMIFIGGLLIFFSNSFEGLGFNYLEELFFSFYMVLSAKTAGYSPINISYFNNISLIVIMISM